MTDTESRARQAHETDLAYWQRIGPKPGETAEQFAARLERITQAEAARAEAATADWRRMNERRKWVAQRTRFQEEYGRVVAEKVVAYLRGKCEHPTGGLEIEFSRFFRPDRILAITSPLDDVPSPSPDDPTAVLVISDAVAVPSRFRGVGDAVAITIECRSQNQQTCEWAMRQKGAVAQLLDAAKIVEHGITGRRVQCLIKACNIRYREQVDGSGRTRQVPVSGYAWRADRFYVDSDGYADTPPPLPKREQPVIHESWMTSSGVEVSAGDVVKGGNEKKSKSRGSSPT